VKEITGNLWDFYDQGHWVVITTNGMVKKDGTAVMGRGVARDAAQRFPELPAHLGAAIKQWGNKVSIFMKPPRIISFPVKHHWRDQADPELILESAQYLSQALSRHVEPSIFKPPVYMVRPGCGNGGLEWSMIRPMLVPILDDRFIVVEKG
jgi:hypothetical protein